VRVPRASDSLKVEAQVMKRTRAIAALFALLGLAPWGVGQTIEVGDRIQVLVLDDEALSIPTVEVQEDGSIYHPLLGRIPVVDRDRATLAEQIAGMLKDELRDPHVAVNMVEKHPVPVAYVLGEVRDPGAHPIVGPGTVREMLVQAGGVTERAAANRTVVIGAGGERRTIDLGAGLETGAGPESERVVEGDAILVPARNALAVIGAVVKPGSVHLPDGAGVQEALAAAGGLAPNANEADIVLLHDGEKTLLSEEEAGIPVTEADAIIVGAREPAQMTVLGEVNRQGTYPVEDDADVAALLAAGGGPTEKADLARVKLLRPGSPVAALDLRELFLDGSSADNAALEDGDTLIVPEKLPRRVTVWGMVKLPGIYDLEAGNRLFDVIAQAGGLTEKAEKRYAVVVKGADRIAHQVPLLTKKSAVEGAEVGEALELDDGDIVFVPARGDRLEWRDALTALGVITLAIDRF
jgi:protein involved in polysaccharide export with SLBB domain